ncbi:proline racemase family protein [Natribacillus halophilus]|uniref:Proline racemase n=1 Tax=Natribacillus halophilus TaxID=549003 RepID=A0A1G8R9K8_9BACI|nr:proline racemase family protein [Natribacillus halophilus]SDJ13215.1 proline racemase [Natribacillus halophilus]
MKADGVFFTIDTHTGGNPTRTVLSGVPKLKGKTMDEKMLEVQKEHDWIRRLLMYEPRGHDVMSGALLVEPYHPEADFGVIFIETGGYLPMCGHDTIGVCTALVETGVVQATSPDTWINLDTPAGLVQAKVEIENGKAKAVEFKNVPAFHMETVNVNVTDIGAISCDIAYGGNFYAIVDADSLGLRLTPENAPEIVDKGIRIRNAVNENVIIQHPEKPFIQGVTHVEFFTTPDNPKAHVKNTVIVPPGGIDRSPCGTGTSAKLANLHHYQRWQKKDTFVHESIVGSLFEARIIEVESFDTHKSVTTMIKGSAWLMGMHQFFHDQDDVAGKGFLLVPPMNGHS